MWLNEITDLDREATRARLAASPVKEITVKGLVWAYGNFGVGAVNSNRFLGCEPGTLFVRSVSMSSETEGPVTTLAYQRLGHAVIYNAGKARWEQVSPFPYRYVEMEVQICLL
jgi:hypothetical protein